MLQGSWPKPPSSSVGRCPRARREISTMPSSKPSSLRAMYMHVCQPCAQAHRHACACTKRPSDNNSQWQRATDQQACNRPRGGRREVSLFRSATLFRTDRPTAEHHGLDTTKCDAIAVLWPQKVVTLQEDAIERGLLVPCVQEEASARMSLVSSTTQSHPCPIHVPSMSHSPSMTHPEPQPSRAQPTARGAHPEARPPSQPSPHLAHTKSASGLEC